MPLSPSTKPSCTTLLLLVLLSLSLLTLYTLHHPPHPPPPSLTTFLSTSTNSTISTYLRHLTSQPHLAGTPSSLSTALYLHHHFLSLSLPSHLHNLSSLLSYPIHSSLTLHFPNHTLLPLPLSEPASSLLVRPYHAYSPSGHAFGSAVFLNYGREEDYESIRVDVKGCVGVVRRGKGMTRYKVVDNAAERGLAAVLMYTESGGGGWRDGVERGTVMEGLGDPLSPGWGSVEDGERLEIGDERVERRFPRIPSLPVSEEAAERILETLEGGRVPFEWMDEEFRRGSSGIVVGRVGPGPTMVNFSYEGELKTENIHNVFAVIEGSKEPDRFVLLGNHRDAWTYGAVDPNSGTAALMDIARRYALLMRLGWRPRRTIVFASWDAEEFGMIGSTEWVEQNLVNLGKAVAYLNVDCAAQGPGFFISTTPQLDDLLVEVTKKVKDPGSDNGNLFEGWTAVNRGVNIQRLSRADSDFAPFLHHAGVPSIDLYYGADFPVYHTAFDSYDWMMNFGDPLFQRHVTVAGVWGLVGLHLADDAIVPFNYLTYATELLEYKNVLNTLLEGTVSLDPISAAIRELKTAAKEAADESKELQLDENLDESVVLRRRRLNDRLMLAERGFLDSEGLPGRQWFKHIIYGPPSNTESKISFFPGIADAMSRRMNERERQAAIQHEIWRVARAIQRAALALRGQFT